MSYKIKLKMVVLCCFMIFALNYCTQRKFSKELDTQESKFHWEEKNAIDSLKRYNLYNYLDSAYLYTYIYFGSAVLKRCGKINIDSVLPDVSTRKVICQNLLLRRVRFIPDSSFVFLALTPLVNDSILSCDMVEGAQFPDEVMFNYKTKCFVQFVYNETSFLKVNANLIEDYEKGLKKILESDNLKPHKKFRDLLSRLVLR